MLDHFVWGKVGRISPEAPVPVVDFDRESYIPGGAANVARNLAALSVPTELFGVVGRDAAAAQLKRLLGEQKIGCDGLLAQEDRATSVKMRIVAHQQQVVRLDREIADGIGRAGDGEAAGGAGKPFPRRGGGDCGGLRQGRDHAAVAGGNQGALPPAGRLAEPGPEAGASVEFEGIVADYAEPQGGV